MSHGEGTEKFQTYLRTRSTRTAACVETHKNVGNKFQTDILPGSQIKLLEKFAEGCPTKNFLIIFSIANIYFMIAHKTN